MLAPPEDAVRVQLQRILGSHTFARSRRQQRFLEYAVESVLAGKSEALKESVLGMAVFDRGEAFDPRSDNIVRVEARRLRQRLDEYYRNEGGEDEVAIEFPTGSYVPQFSQRETPTASPVVSTIDPRIIPPPTRRFRFGVFLVIGAAALAGIAACAFLWLHSRKPISIAVLPFSDFSGGDEERYHADGITEDITQALAQTRRLRVVARTSAFQFRGKSQDVREIGRRLGVSRIVEGSVQNRDGRLRISARLVNTEDGFEVWSATEETDGAGIERAERALTAGLAQAMKTSPAATALHVPPAAAQDLVLRARYLAGRGGEENRRRAVELYERAAALDPEYARPRAALASILSLEAFHDPAAAPALAPRVRAAARRAIELDGTIPESHVALARLAWCYEWDWNAAERHWLRALELNPSHAPARQSYALALASRGRFREAVAESQRAAELDPLSFAASSDLGVVLYASRQFDRATAHARRSLTLAPDALPPHFLLGVAAAAAGRYAEAISELERHAERFHRAPAVIGRLGNAYARTGRRDEAAALLAEILRGPDAPRIYAAMIQTALGDRPAALASLEQSAARRETDFLFLGVEPVFDPLRQEPRFAALLAKLGLAAK